LLCIACVPQDRVKDKEGSAVGDKGDRDENAVTPPPPR
jgi:hypothetical protein